MRGRTIRWLLPLALVAATGAGAAVAAASALHGSSASATVKAVKSSKYGMVLAAANGRTVYRFTPDRKEHATCTGACAKFWPPLVAKGSAKPTAGSGVHAGLLGVVMRAGGVHQVTYAGFPLYTYAGDHKAGQVNGEGFQGKWYVVNEQGALVKHAVKSSSGGGGSTWG